MNDNTLTVYIKRLREKLEDDPADPAADQDCKGTGLLSGGVGNGAQP